jgi:predicted DNA-binding transcriptional regulator YafY
VANKQHESVLAQSRGEAHALTVFLKGIFDKQAVALDYASPYGGARYQDYAAPHGILWDRDRWYLIGRQLTGREKLRFWRADRVIAIVPHAEQVDTPEEFSKSSAHRIFSIGSG